MPSSETPPTSLTWNSPLRGGWLASEQQEPFCLSPWHWATSMCYPHSASVLMWILNSGSQACKANTLPTGIYCPSPCLALRKSLCSTLIIWDFSVYDTSIQHNRAASTKHEPQNSTSHTDEDSSLRVSTAAAEVEGTASSMCIQLGRLFLVLLSWPSSPNPHLCASIFHRLQKEILKSYEKCLKHYLAHS